MLNFIGSLLEAERKRTLEEVGKKLADRKQFSVISGKRILEKDMVLWNDIIDVIKLLLEN